MKKPTRTISGVTPVTVFTKPYACSGNCLFCPKETQSPKSYLGDEPGIQRANALNFDPKIQTAHRINSYKDNQHNTGKIEIIISGGTWHDYPEKYRLKFLMDIYAQLNDEKHTDNYVTVSYQNLYKLQKCNENATHRCVGLSIETRPDKINLAEITKLRQLGVTKVQLGIQSTYDRILDLNNRGHSLQQSFNAINLLRANGFKIQLHWMCNLYGSSPKKDVLDYKRLFSNKNLHPDELKIYPCCLISSSDLYSKYLLGEYKPYDYDTLANVLTNCKLQTKAYCRISRLFRDIPAQYIVSGVNKSNIREDLQKQLYLRKKPCKCIRCREIRELSFNSSKEPKLSIIKYKTAISTEYFLQMTQEAYIKHISKMQDLNKDKLLGFLRLSIYNKKAYKLQIYPFKSMIREIHVYGRSLNVDEKSGDQTQHKGIGSYLISQAENITKKHHIKSIAVIASVGTREYYRKKDFEIMEKLGYGIKKLL